MADTPNPALRDQLINDRNALAQAIRGLPDVASTTVSPDAVTVLNQQLAIRVRRRDLIQDVLDVLDRVVAALDLLEADGWPAPVSKATVSASIFEELQEEQSDVQAAVAVFQREQAASIKVNLGAPTPKT